jgi:hypothetical protein
MKKVFLIPLLVLVVLAGLFVAAWMSLPKLAFHMLGKAVGGAVEASRSSFAFRGGLLVLRLDGIRIKGNVRGTVGTCELQVQPSKGIYVKYFTISDFDIKVGNERGRIGLYPVPVELARITNGRVDYGGRKYVLREMTVANFNTGRPLEFTIDGGIEGLGNLKTKGGGVFFPEKRSDIRGEYRLSGVHMDRVFKDYEGLADSRGTYTYKDGRLVMDGDVTAPYFSLMETFLRKRIVSTDNDCRIHLTTVGGVSDVTLSGLAFKGTPLFLKFSADSRTLHSLELKTDLMSIADVMEYINPALMSEGDWGPLSFVKGGLMRIDRLVFQRGEPFTAQIDVRDVEVGNGRVNLTDVAGSLRLSGTALVLDDFEGRLGAGRISQVSGLLPLRLDRDVRVKGRFSLSLPDVLRLAGAGTGSIRVLSGLTEGGMEIQGRKDRGFSMEGRGTVRDGRFLFRKMELGASGNYTFRNGKVTLAPLVIGRGQTSLVLSGEARKDEADVHVKGVVGGAQIKELLGCPCPMEGPVAVEASLGLEGSAFRATGRLAMTDLSFQIPRVLRKEGGIESWAALSLHGRKGGDVVVDSLSYTLGPLHAFLSGRIGKNRISAMRVALDVPDVGGLSRLFFFENGKDGGDLRAELTLDDLPFPVTRLPRTTGYISFTRGVLHPPELVNPLTGINLFCKFEGDRFTIDLSGLRSGESVLSRGHLAVTGVTRPSFTLDIDMDRFDPADFAMRKERPFRLPVIAEDSLAARMTGDFLIRAKTLPFRGVTGTDLVLQGAYENRTIAVAAGRVGAAEGDLVFEGSVRLASLPRLEVSGRAKDVTAREVLALFGGKPDVFEGTGSVVGNLTFTGRDAKEMARSASGRISVESRNGVIRKWNVISKILAVTNVYDLFAGRVDLSRNGLFYRRLSASFEGENGVFRTRDFLIHSPSMLITGQGLLDVGEKEMDGRMTVSPFVTMDRIIEALPLVRNIFHERGNGIIFFVYDIKGPARDPEIKSRYIRSVGARLVYMLRNALNLPKGVWDELNKELEKKEPQR